jgi:hypothetical protein
VRLAAGSDAKSITVASEPTGPTPIVLLTAANLLASSPGCVNASAGRRCTVVVYLGPGQWRVTAQTYDRIDGKGRELAKGSLTVTVKKGAIENVHLVLTNT